MPYAFLDFLEVNFDPHGDQHASNVSDWASILANQIPLPSQEIKRIELAARYHDIGKMFVPESIRRFHGIYTPVERYAMQKHSQIGAQMLQLLDFDPDVITMILAHHENYDGTGYPNGIRGEQIPIGARVIRIVDSFDAITRNNTYQRAISNHKALQRLRDRKQHYDPELLQLFGEIISTWTQKVI